MPPIPFFQSLVISKGAQGEMIPGSPATIMRASVVLATLGVVCATPTTILKREAIPGYALTYAPYTILYSGEGWWPSDITTHLAHVTPKASFISASRLVAVCSTSIDQVDSVAVADAVTLATLNSITADAFLKSNDDVEDDPAWLTSTDNKPDGMASPGHPQRSSLQIRATSSTSSISISTRTITVSVFSFPCHF